MGKILTGFVLGVLVAVPAAAQTVDEVIAKHIDALGGLTKMQAVKSVRMSGRMTVGPGMEAPMVLEIKRPNALRVDFTIQGMVGSQAYDGSKAWQFMPFDGSTAPQEMSPEETIYVAEQADIDGPLVDYKTKGHKVELVGKENVEGSDAYKLKVTLKSGNVRTIYLDAASYLEIKEEGKRIQRGTEIETETIMSDYKAVDGLMMPHLLDTAVKNTSQRQKIVIEKIEFNAPIDDARFKMPAKEVK
jgi:outer membrane lipoprotein-sorting protein